MNMARLVIIKLEELKDCRILGMKKIVIFAMGLVLSSTTHAQEKIETTISGDFVSSYIWRGQDLGSAAVQPTLGVGYKGMSLTAWGSYGLANPDDVKEFDLTLGYAVGGFNIGVTDYWFNAGLDPDGRYFKYDAHSTNHLFEANIGYDFGFASLQWFTNFAGNDGVNKDGKRAYSSYVEANVPFSLAGVRICCHQPFAPRYERNQGDRQVLHPHLRTGDGQSLYTESLSGFWFNAATLIFARFSSHPPSCG